MLTVDEVRGNLIEVIKMIQTESGYPQPVLCGTSCPVAELEGFDSPLWVVVMTLLSQSLNVDIPKDLNIFVAHDDDENRYLSIDESAACVCEALGQLNR